MNSENVPLYNFSHGQRKKVARIFGGAKQIDWYALYLFFILGSIHKIYLSLKERDASIDESHDHPHRNLCCPLLQSDGAPEAEKIDGKDKAAIYFVIWVSKSSDYRDVKTL